jgi:hypothetical protein
MKTTTEPYQKTRWLCLSDRLEEKSHFHPRKRLLLWLKRFIMLKMLQLRQFMKNSQLRRLKLRNQCMKRLLLLLLLKK